MSAKKKPNVAAVTHSGKITLGDIEVPVHVLTGGMPVVEITSIETMIGLPESGLGAFLASLPGTDRIEFMRASQLCSMCSAPASHFVRESGDKVCGGHRAWCEKRGIATREWGSRDHKAVGLPAEKIPDLLKAYWLANPTTEAGNKASEILRMLCARGLRAMGQNPANADILMAALTAERRSR